jgi:hypothetical protein
VLTGSYADRIQRFYQEAVVGGNWDYARELIAPHAQITEGTGPESKIGPMSHALAGLTDVSVDIRHLVEGGGQVAVHYVLSATDTGGFSDGHPRASASAFGPSTSGASKASRWSRTGPAPTGWACSSSSGWWLRHGPRSLPRSCPPSFTRPCCYTRKELRCVPRKTKPSSTV